MIEQADIRRLQLPEKLALLESVWAEISSQPDDVEVPQWHKDLLDERNEALEEGRMQILDWEQAKQEIQSATR